MILTDANILMYAAGAEHLNKAPSVAFLNRVAAGEVAATIDAEVFQEVLHRYRALHRWADGQRVFDLARKLFPEVLAITGEVMDEARHILAADATLTARDAVHAAVVIVYRLEGICSFDADFDRIAGCPRLTLTTAISRHSD
ncbi:MAG: type II toxin-antitoxin system VapC family toxin [Bryobacteraceae bacterium]